MRSLCKMLLLSLVILSLSKDACCQYVQPMGYKDYSFWDQVNIGNKGAKLTHASAYLELGKPSGSNRGFLLPRGNKDSIPSPAYGLMIYNTPDSLVYWYDGSAWRTSSAGGSGSGRYPTDLNYNSNVLTLSRSGLPDLTTTLPFSSKLNVADTAGKWAGMVYRRGDSLFYKKGTTEYFAAKFENTWPGLPSDYMAGDGSVVDFAGAVQSVGNSLWSPLGHTQPFSTITDGPSAVRNLFGANAPLSYNPLTGTFSMSGTTAQDGLISGGIVTWSGSGLVFDVTAASYVIGGASYNTSQSQVTLDPADATYGRYDVITVDNTGHATKITGTPAASPVIPQIDPANQIYLTTVFIAAGATTPTQVSNEVIYDENTEWSHTTSGTVTANFANTSVAENGTKSISTSWSSASNLIFTNGSTLVSSNYTTISFYIRLNNNLANNTNVSIQFYNSANPVSNQVAASFSKSTTSIWQLVSFNVSQFSFTSSQFNSVRFILTGSTISALTTTTVYFDNIRLQAGLTPPQTVQGLQSAYSKVTDGTNTATSAGSDVLKLRSVDNKLSILVGNNDAAHGDNVLFTINQNNLLIPLSSLTAAAATNSINNANYTQAWSWNTLSGPGLQLNSSSSAASGNAQKLLDVFLSGANSNSGEQTYAIVGNNQHSGTGALNVGVYGIADNGPGGNYAVWGQASGSAGAGVYGTNSGSGAGGKFTNSGSGPALETVSGGVKFGGYGSGSRTGTATYNLGVDVSGNVIEISPGGGGTVAAHGVTVLKNYVTQTTSTGSGTTDNITVVTIPANGLSANGDAIVIEFAYTTTGSDTKSTNLVIGSTSTLIASGASTTAGFYSQKLKILRTNTTSGVIRAESWRDFSMQGVSAGIVSSLDWTSAQNLVVSLTSLTAASITINYVTVRVEKE
jgi:hypothetical protein